MAKKLLTVAEYAEKMQIPAITVYKQVKRGNLKAVVKFGRTLISEDAKAVFKIK